MSFRLILALAATLMASQLAACATVVEGTEDKVSFETTPAGARCGIERDGAKLGTVDATPGTLTLVKSKADLAVTCEKTGHLTVTERVESEFTGATIGNILLGGGVGLIVDAASGANNRYPALVKVILPPEKFPTPAERDSYFDGLKADINGRYDKIAARAKDTCPANNQAQCDSEAAKVEEKRQKELTALETKRQAVKIG